MLYQGPKTYSTTKPGGKPNPPGNTYFCGNAFNQLDCGAPCPHKAAAECPGFANCWLDDPAVPFCVFEEKTLATLAPTTSTRKITTTTTETTEAPATTKIAVAQNVKVASGASDVTLYCAIAVAVGFVTFFARPQ
jgi:hypothetical protein